MNLLKFMRGIKANLPALNPGEPALTTDTGEVFIGGANGENIGVVSIVQAANEADAVAKTAGTSNVLAWW